MGHRRGKIGCWHSGGNRCIRDPVGPFSLLSSERGSAIEASVMVRPGNVAASGGSCSAFDRRGLAALLLLAALAPATAVAQRTLQPAFTELFAYDPAAPSQ